MSPKGVLEAFKGWMKSVGIQYSDAIELVDAAQGCSGLALGVRAARDIAEGERLCTIPKAACLSTRTTQLADVIEAEELGGGLGLVLAVLHEMSLGEESKWHGYFRALPPREYLPLFWSDEQLRLLRGTELEHSVAADRAAAAEDFEEHVQPLVEKYPGRLRPDFLTLDNFHAAASFVASRAFGVDEWHGDAMVPLADVFNHKASVVDLGAAYEVHGAQSDSDEDDGSGSEEEESGSEEVEEDEEGGSEEEAEEGSEEEAGGGSGLAAGHGPPVAGEGSGRYRHSDGCCSADGRCGRDRDSRSAEDDGAGDIEPAAAAAGCGSALPSVMAASEAAIYGLSSANGLHLRLEMGIVDLDEHTLEIVAASAVPAGAEVHNTYGELGNAELVKKYGFALRQNPFTAVELGKAALLADARARLGAARWRARCRLLQEGSNVLEEEEEPFEALPNGHISPALFVALRVLCAPDEEAATWRHLADALPPSSGAAGSSGSSGSSDGEAGKAGDAGEAEGSEEEEATAPLLGVVQVWPVLDSGGQRLEPAAAAAAAAAAQDAVAGQQQAAAGAHAALLSRDAWELVQAAARRRLEAYAEPLEADLQQLAASDAQQQQQQRQQQQGQQQVEGPAGRQQGSASAPAAAAAAAALSEGQVAQRAALLLRVTEKEVLRDLLAALKMRLASLPREQQGKKAKKKAGSGGQQPGKRKAAAAGERRAGQEGGGVKRRPAGR